MSVIVLIGCEDGDIPCDLCSGTGDLIMDWDRYISAKTTEEIEDCESDYPDCSGYGRFKAESRSPRPKGVSGKNYSVRRVFISKTRDLVDDFSEKLVERVSGSQINAKPGSNLNYGFVVNVDNCLSETEANNVVVCSQLGEHVGIGDRPL